MGPGDCSLLGQGFRFCTFTHGSVGNSQASVRESLRWGWELRTERQPIGSTVREVTGHQGLSSPGSRDSLREAVQNVLGKPQIRAWEGAAGPRELSPQNWYLALLQVSSWVFQTSRTNTHRVLFFLHMDTSPESGKENITHQAMSWLAGLAHSGSFL